VRAFDPWPVAEAQLGGELLRIWKAAVVDEDVTLAPGSIVAAGRDGIDVACASGVLRLLEVQRAGGRRIRAADLANSLPDLKPGR
jgi:methionyl-tRNA formyltransferase